MSENVTGRTLCATGRHHMVDGACERCGEPTDERLESFLCEWVRDLAEAENLTANQCQQLRKLANGLRLLPTVLSRSVAEVLYARGFAPCERCQHPESCTDGTLLCIMPDVRAAERAIAQALPCLAPEPSETAIEVAARKMWIEPGRLDLAATAEGLRAAYAIDGQAAAPPDNCVHCGEPMGVADDPCWTCYSIARGQIAVLQEQLDALRAAAPAERGIRQAVFAEVLAKWRDGSLDSMEFDDWLESKAASLLG